MGILGDEGEPGVEAGSEEATCRQRATKESMKMLQTEERTKECDSRGELGDMGVVAGDGAESQDQEVRAQRYRRELGEEERRHRGGMCVCYRFRSFYILYLSFLTRAPLDPRYRPIISRHVAILGTAQRVAIY